jgi:malonyl-CoA decarboxylase
MADTSPKGQQQSITLMLNYYYDLSQIEENHENFAHNGYINATDEVKAFAREAQAMLAS